MLETTFQYSLIIVGGLAWIACIALAFYEEHNARKDMK